MVNLVNYSRRLEAALGVPPLVRVKGKGPFDLGWSQGPREQPDLWRRKLRDWIGNVGLVTGGQLVAVDVDLYAEGAEDSWESLRGRGFTEYTVTNLTGGGGRHYLYATPPGTKVLSHALTGFPGIDIKGHGGCIVIPPSVHPDTGREYEWEHSWGPEDEVLVMLDQAQIEVLGVGSVGGNGLRVLDERDETAVTILCERLDGHHPRRRPQTIEVTRPGKQRGLSAEVGFLGPGVVRVWSTHWPGLPEGIYELWKLRQHVGIPPHHYRIRPAEHDTLIPVGDLKSRRQRWLWQDFLPAGQLTLAVGNEKLGKSTGAVWVAAHATRGTLPGDYEGEPITVAFISAEDEAERVLKPRAVAAGADLSRFHVLDPRGPGFTLDFLDTTDVQLVILDPMSVYIALSSTNEHGEINIRNALDPFSSAAYRRDLTVVGIRHTRKAGAGDNPFDVVLGSRAWSAAARSVVFFAKDKQNPEAPGGLLFAKGNLTPEAGARRYRLDSTPVLLDDDTLADVPLFVLSEGGVGITLEEALGPGDRATARTDAEEFLEEQLPMKADDAKALAKAEGISLATLKRAKKTLGVISRRVGFGDADWWWVFPEGAHLSELSPFDEKTGKSAGGSEGAHLALPHEGAHLYDDHGA